MRGDNLSDITIHELKILPAYFNDVFSGRKNFEIRKNDRGFRVNHILMLREFDGKNYTGSYIHKKITYITDYNQKDNHVVMGMEDTFNGN